jgi:hypothetical protein
VERQVNGMEWVYNFQVLLRVQQYNKPDSDSSDAKI